MSDFCHDCLVLRKRIEEMTEAAEKFRRSCFAREFAILTAAGGKVVIHEEDLAEIDESCRISESPDLNSGDLIIWTERGS